MNDTVLKRPYCKMMDCDNRQKSFLDMIYECVRYIAYGFGNMSGCCLVSLEILFPHIQHFQVLSRIQMLLQLRGF